MPVTMARMAPPLPSPRQKKKKKKFNVCRDICNVHIYLYVEMRNIKRIVILHIRTRGKEGGTEKVHMLGFNAGVN